MAQFTINSKKFGAQTFSVRDSSCGTFGGYVRLHTEKGLVQIGENGNFSGSMVSCKEVSLEKVAKKWWKKRLKNLQETF